MIYWQDIKTWDLMQLKPRLKRLPRTWSDEIICPPLILDVNDFSHLTKERMLEEYQRVMALSSQSAELKAVVGIDNPEEVKEKHLTVLLTQYELLRGLRLGDGDAWATVNELYEDD